MYIFDQQNQKIFEKNKFNKNSRFKRLFLYNNIIQSYTSIMSHDN